MTTGDSRVIDNESSSRWYRFGVLIGVANLLFIAILIVLLQFDPIVGIGFAVVVSVVSGIAVTWYALGQR